MSSVYAGISTMLSSGNLLAMVREPNIIIRPIAQLLGSFFNILFELVYSVIQSGSFGITIILFTILVKLLMVPLMLNQQKSMKRMQQVQPQMQKIQEKYKNSKDPESQQKMSQELAAFYKENKVNPLGGCLPLLLQMPIFFALFFVLQQASLYIVKIKDLYVLLAAQVTNIPGHIEMLQSFVETRRGMTFDLGSIEGIGQLLSKLNSAEWVTLQQSATDVVMNQLMPLLQQKEQIENFMGINLIDAPGMVFPGVLLPILAGLTTYLSSKSMSSGTAQNAQGNPQAMQTQKTMTMIFPFLTAFMTVTLPAGLGIYWTVSNVFQLGQQYAVNKYLLSDGEKEGS